MTRRFSPRRRMVATTLAGAMALTPFMLSAFGPITVSAHAAGITVTKYSLASGVKLTTYAYATGPEQVRVLTITQGTSSIDMAKAANAFGVQYKPSAIAAKAYYDGSTYGSGIAATNGAFARNLMPVHLEMLDGQVATTGIQGGFEFGLNADGSHAYIGNPGFSYTWTNGPLNASLKPPRIDAWNSGAPGAGLITGYSSIGGTVQKPPGGGATSFCEVHLVPSAPPAWSNPTTKAGITRSYTVDQIGTAPCSTTAMSVGSTPDAVVLASAATGAGATALKTLALNNTVTLTTKFNGWPGVVDAVGGTPVLVNNGVNVGPGFTTGDNYIFDYNPRTAVGFNAACSDTDPLTLCKIYLVTVDGRQSAWSAGWRMNQLGDFFVNKLNAQYALNLDGGGGTVMWVHKSPATFTPPCIKSASTGCLVNKPADLHGERTVIMALVAIPGTDLGIPASLR